MHARAILIALLSFIVSSSFTQVKTVPVLYTLSEKDGLTDNVVNCFFEDSRSVIWMGTSSGLNSYDGSIISNFHPNITGTSLADEVVNGICEDNRQTLWLATGNGLCAYQLFTKTFSSFRMPAGGEASNRFYSIAISGNMLFLATEAGLVTFDINTHVFTRYNIPDAIANRVTKIMTDSKQRTWLATYNGLWRYEPASHEFTACDQPANDPSFDELVTDVFEDHAGQIWFGTWNKGIKKINPENNTVENFFHYKNNNGNVTSITEQQTPGGGYRIWESSNVCSPDPATQSFSYLYTGTAADSKPLLSNRLFCSSDNLLWISTTTGVKIYNPVKQYFQTTILSSYVPLTSQGIALYPLKDRFLLGGEGGSSLMLFNNSVKLVKNLSSVIHSGQAVMQIQQDAKGGYWLCTSNGLLYFDSTFSRRRLFLHNDRDEASLPKDFLNASLVRNNGEVWLLPWRRGAWRIDAAAQQFYRVTTPNGDTLLKTANLSKAIEDNNGNIWLTDYSAGLFRYNPRNGVVDNVIGSRRLSNIYCIDGRVWTVTASEIFCTDINTAKTETWLLPAGKNKYEYDFIPDGRGWLWIATKTGLVAFNMQTHVFKTFSEDDGLFMNNVEVTMARLSNGNILLAGTTYATVFSPAMAEQQTGSLPLLFTGARVGEREKIAEDSILHFSWGETNISFHWALLHYSNPRGNQYYYKLEGVDKDWQLAGNHGQVSYNSLAPGSYLFYYKASTSDGVMSGTKSIRVIIHPPFWKTWWFIFVGIALASLLFYSVVRYISQRNLKEKLLRLEKEQAIEKERNRISRDMHDDLGSGLTKIAILSEVIRTQPLRDDATLDKISETARGLVDNLDEMVWALNPKNDSLDKLAAYIAAYTHQFLDNTGISAEVSLPQEIRPVYLGEQKRRNLFMTVKEFLNNSVKHSGARNISLRMVQHTTDFELILEDDGRGIDHGALDGLGNGLANMQQRIADIGGEALIHSLPGKGTVLHITCPV